MQEALKPKTPISFNTLTDEELLSKLRAAQESSPLAVETNEEGPEACDEEGSHTEVEEEDDGGEEEEMKEDKESGNEEEGGEDDEESGGEGEGGENDAKEGSKNTCCGWRRKSYNNKGTSKSSEKSKKKARKIPKWIEICNATADGILESHPVEERISRKKCAMKSGWWYNKLTGVVRERDYLPWHCVTCNKGFHESCYYGFHMANFPAL